MAYRREQLDRFADQIPDQQLAAEFRQVASKIEFDKDGIFGSSALDVFNGTAVENLREEFGQRHKEFLKPEDFARFSSKPKKVSEAPDNSVLINGKWMSMTEVVEKHEALADMIYEGSFGNPEDVIGSDRDFGEYIHTS